MSFQFFFKKDLKICFFFWFEKLFLKLILIFFWIRSENKVGTRWNMKQQFFFSKKKHFQKTHKTSSSRPIAGESQLISTFTACALENHVNSVWVCSVFAWVWSLPSAVLTLSLWALKTLSISAGAIVPSKPTGIPFVLAYGTIGVVGVGGADDANGDCNCLISSFIRRSSAPVWSGKDRLIRFELHFLRLARKFTSFLMFISNPLSVPLRSSRSEVEEVPFPWVVLGLWFSYLLRVRTETRDVKNKSQGYS